MGISAQPDAATQVINLSQVLNPKLIDAAQDHGAQDTRPDLWPKLRRFLVECLKCGNLNRINKDCVFNNVLKVHWWLNASALQVSLEPL